MRVTGSPHCPEDHPGQGNTRPKCPTVGAAKQGIMKRVCQPEADPLRERGQQMPASDRAQATIECETCPRHMRGQSPAGKKKHNAEAPKTTAHLHQGRAPQRGRGEKLLIPTQATHSKTQMEQNLRAGGSQTMHPKNPNVSPNTPG